MTISPQIRKTKSHGHIGEAAVTAKCWMNGVPAYNTNGLRANFAGSDLIIDTADPRRKLLVQVKAGFSPSKGMIYLTQATGESDLTSDKFRADFVVFVNIDRKVGEAHQHLGTLDFHHLTFYVVPCDVANAAFKSALQRERERPLNRTPERERKLTYLAVNVEPEILNEYKDAWHLLRGEPSV